MNGSSKIVIGVVLGIITIFGTLYSLSDHSVKVHNDSIKAHEAQFQRVDKKLDQLLQHFNIDKR